MIGRIANRLARLDRKGRARFFALTAAAALCLGVLLAAVIQITVTLAGREAARREYDGLRRQFAPTAQAAQSAPAPAESAPQSTPPAESEPPKQPWEVNADYVGWLAVPGAGVDYPVVRGADNSRYLNTTFEGSRNAAGAIFMDCGNTQGFAGRHTVLYGHNVKNGSMFGSLKKYLDAGYLAQNPTVTVTLPGGQAQTYAIFAARQTDAWDPAYRLDFADDADFAAFATSLGAPQGTAGLLTFSTCTNGDNDDERILVHAALVAG